MIEAAESLSVAAGAAKVRLQDGVSHAAEHLHRIRGVGGRISRRRDACRPAVHDDQQRNARPLPIVHRQGEDTLDRFAVRGRLPRHNPLRPMREFGGLRVGTRQAPRRKARSGRGVDFGRFAARLGEEGDRSSDRAERGVEPFIAHTRWRSGRLPLGQRNPEQRPTGLHSGLDEQFPGSSGNESGIFVERFGQRDRIPANQRYGPKPGVLRALCFPGRRDDQTERRRPSHNLLVPRHRGERAGLGSRFALHVHSAL